MNSEAVRSNWEGRIVDGRFPLLKWLGGSERSSVFLTELDGDRSRRAAIKLIPASSRGAEAQAAVWELTATLSHPHLMRLFSAGRCQFGDAEVLFVVTEAADEILSEILPLRPLTPTETREMLEPVLDALAYLHAKGFVHSRLKPSNIAAIGDQLKLSCDSLHVAGDPGIHAWAPAAHDAPECASDAVTPAADVWSLGVTLVEALTQYPPPWDRTKPKDPHGTRVHAGAFCGHGAGLPAHRPGEPLLDSRD
jgi:serine/threonine protein kinase